MVVEGRLRIVTIPNTITDRRQQQPQQAALTHKVTLTAGSAVPSTRVSLLPLSTGGRVEK